MNSERNAKIAHMQSALARHGIKPKARASTPHIKRDPQRLLAAAYMQNRAADHEFLRDLQARNLLPRGLINRAIIDRLRERYPAVWAPWAAQGNSRG
jgi:hypothetical protein